jgi:hypothetical protein
MMQPWDMLRREIRHIPYKLVLASSANFTGSLSYGRYMKHGDVMKAFALIFGVLRRLLFLERSWTANKRTVPKIKSQEAVRIPRNADPNALPDFVGFVVPASEP